MKTWQGISEYCRKVLEQGKELGADIATLRHSGCGRNLVEDVKDSYVRDIQQYVLFEIKLKLLNAPYPFPLHGFCHAVGCAAVLALSRLC